MTASPAARRTRLIWRLTALCAVLMVTVGVLAAVLIANHSNTTAHAAARDAQATAQCVNRVLADRNGTSARDAQAHIDFAKALSAVLSAPKESQAQLYQRFVTELHRYVTTLVADQRTRDAHPLGKC